MRSIIFALACRVLEWAWNLAERTQPAPIPRTRRMAECHPDRVHNGHGLCSPCLHHVRYMADRKHCLAVSTEWRVAHRDQWNARRRQLRAERQVLA